MHTVVSKTMISASRDDGDVGIHSQFRAFVLADAVEASKALLMEVKERFQNQHYVLNRFRKLLKNFSKRRIDVESLGVEVMKLFKGHHDLIRKYNAFLPDGYQINSDRGDGVKKLETAIELVNRVKIRFQNEERVYEKFLEILIRIREERFWLHQLKKDVADLFGNHNEDLFEDFERYILEERHSIRSIQDIDLSKCKQVSPSYWLLPDDFQTPLASHRLEVDAQVLNDNLVCCVSTGSESRSFKQRQRTQLEELLFKCEDDRFELDMLLERVNSAAKRAEELMIETDDQNQESEGYFSDMDLSCIERLYGDHGLDVIDYLHKSPKIALPLILKRLKQKQDELVKCRSDFSGVWAHVCAKSHYKLLQRELKNSRREDSLAAEDVSLDVSGNKQSILPNSEVQPLF